MKRILFTITLLALATLAVVAAPNQPVPLDVPLPELEELALVRAMDPSDPFATEHPVFFVQEIHSRRTPERLLGKLEHSRVGYWRGHNAASCGDRWNFIGVGGLAVSDADIPNATSPEYQKLRTDYIDQEVAAIATQILMFEVLDRGLANLSTPSTIASAGPALLSSFCPFHCPTAQVTQRSNGTYAPTGPEVSDALGYDTAHLRYFYSEGRCT